MKIDILTVGFVMMSIMILDSSGQLLTYAQEQDPNVRVEDSSFNRQDLQTGETISNPHVAMIIESLGVGLIFLFIVIYAIKKRRKQK